MDIAIQGYPRVEINFLAKDGLLNCIFERKKLTFKHRFLK